MQRQPRGAAWNPRETAVDGTRTVVTTCRAHCWHCTTQKEDKAVGFCPQGVPQASCWTSHLCEVHAGWGATSLVKDLQERVSRLSGIQKDKAEPSIRIKRKRWEIVTRDTLLEMEVPICQTPEVCCLPGAEIWEIAERLLRLLWTLMLLPVAAQPHSQQQRSQGRFWAFPKSDSSSQWSRDI